MTLPPAPFRSLSNQNSSGLPQAPGQQMAMARPVNSQPTPPVNAVTQHIPPGMQQMQAQLAQMAQAGVQPRLDAMQNILSMMGRGGGQTPGMGLGQLMRPAMPVMPAMPQQVMQQGPAGVPQMPQIKLPSIWGGSSNGN